MGHTPLDVNTPLKFSPSAKILYVPSGLADTIARLIPGVPCKLNPPNPLKLQDNFSLKMN